VLQAVLDLHRIFHYHHSDHGEKLGAHIAMGDIWDGTLSHPKGNKDQKCNVYLHTKHNTFLCMYAH